MIRQQKTGFFSSHRKTLEDEAKFPVKKSEMIGNIDGQMFFLYAQKYNRARQSAITQEITEIVAGSGS